jgi:hypothetical protein
MCVIGLLLMVRKHYIAKIRFFFSLSSCYLANHMFSDIPISTGTKSIEMDIVSLLWDMTFRKKCSLEMPDESNIQIAHSTELKVVPYTWGKI